MKISRVWLKSLHGDTVSFFDRAIFHSPRLSLSGNTLTATVDYDEYAILFMVRRHPPALRIDKFSYWTPDGQVTIEAKTPREMSIVTSFLCSFPGNDSIRRLFEEVYEMIGITLQAEDKCQEGNRG